jgi:hypothetical protein
MCEDASLLFRVERVVPWQLAGYEVQQRFYETGSPSGLSEFERWLTTRA